MVSVPILFGTQFALRADAIQVSSGWWWKGATLRVGDPIGAAFTAATIGVRIGRHVSDVNWFRAVRDALGLIGTLELLNVIE